MSRDEGLDRGGGSLPAVEAHDLVLAHADHIALDRSSISIPTASLVACIGPNGSGKSTLLDAVCGLITPRSGEIEVLGRSPGRADIAYVFQSTDTPVHLPLTVREVVTMGRYRKSGLWGRLGDVGRRAVDRAMTRMGVAELAGRQLLELSGGQRQRVLVAQGLASEADLLVLDEPMTGLDVVSRERVTEVMRSEQHRGSTVVFSTHDLSEAAAADHVVLLSGRVVASGPPGAVLTPDHLADAYKGHLVGTGGLLIDDPHHHGPREDRHDGHRH